MPRESELWRDTIRPSLAPYGILERIENSLGTKGIADVNYCLLGVEGWIELKRVLHWPTRPLTSIKLPHFTIDQLRWHERRHKHGGHTCVIAQIERDFVLMPAMTLAQVFRGMTRADYQRVAAVYGEGRFPTIAMVKWLTKR